MTRVTVKAVRKHNRTDEYTIVDVTVIKCKYPSLEGEWYQIVDGGVTGYESCRATCKLNHGWLACAGTPGSWDMLFIPADSTAQFKQLSLTDDKV